MLNASLNGQTISHGDLPVIDILTKKGYWEIVSGKSECPKVTGKAKSQSKPKARMASCMLSRLLNSTHHKGYAEDHEPRNWSAKLENWYVGKNQARIWFLPEKLSNISKDYYRRPEPAMHQTLKTLKTLTATLDAASGNVAF